MFSRGMRTDVYAQGHHGCGDSAIDQGVCGLRLPRVLHVRHGQAQRHQCRR